MILVKNTPFSIKGEAFSHLNPAACFLAAHLNHFHISKPKRCFISMTSTATDQWSPNCFDSTFLPGMSEHAPPKCLLIYLWTRYMYFWSTHIFFLPTYKTVHPTSETTVTHEGKKKAPKCCFQGRIHSPHVGKRPILYHTCQHSHLCATGNFYRYLMLQNW